MQLDLLRVNLSMENSVLLLHLLDLFGLLFFLLFVELLFFYFVQRLLFHHFFQLAFVLLYLFELLFSLLEGHFEVGFSFDSLLLEDSKTFSFFGFVFLEFLVQKLLSMLFFSE